MNVNITILTTGLQQEKIRVIAAAITGNSIIYILYNIY